MKKFSFIAICILSVFSLASCLKDDNTEPVPVSIVSIWNFYNHPSSVYYEAGGRLIDRYDGRYKGYTSFMAIPGNKNIKVTRENDNKKLIDTSLTFVDTISYSTFVFGELDKAKYFRVNDVGVQDLATKTGVRFLHLASGIGKVDFQIGDQTIEGITDRVQENEETTAESQKFRISNSGTFTITATDDNGKVLVKREDIKLTEGTYMNFVLVGTKGNTNFPLQLLYTIY